MKEEKLNAWSHAVGCVFAVWACWALMAKCNGCDWAYKVGVVVFVDIYAYSSELYASVVVDTRRSGRMGRIWSDVGSGDRRYGV